jgi:hypothetical protein
MQGMLLLVFVGMLAVLLYTLRSMTAERVCLPSWAGYPHGMHLNIAIVTMTDTNSKLHDKVKVTALSQTACCWSRTAFICVAFIIVCIMSAFGCLCRQQSGAAGTLMACSH